MPSIVRGVDDFDSLESQGLGDGQTWQDVVASRAPGVTYTNSTGRPILVHVVMERSDQITVTLVVDGISVSRHNEQGVVQHRATLTAVIPNGSTYSVSVNINVISNWVELR